MNVPRAWPVLRGESCGGLHGGEEVLHFAVTAIAGLLSPSTYDTGIRLHVPGCTAGAWTLRSRFSL